MNKRYRNLVSVIVGQDLADDHIMVVCTIAVAFFCLLTPPVIVGTALVLKAVLW